MPTNKNSKEKKILSTMTIQKALKTILILSLPFSMARIQGVNRILSPNNNDAIECTIVEIESFSLNNEDPTFYRCIIDDEDHKDFNIEGLSDEFFRNNPISSGISTLSISSGKIKRANHDEPNTITVTPGALLSVSNQHNDNPQNNSQETRNLRHQNGQTRRRKLFMKEGQPTFLVVRVIDDSGYAPDKTAPELSDDVFGTFGDSANLVTQYDACSKGKLKFQKATGNEHIHDGVIEVTLPYNLTGITRFTAMDYAVAETQKVLSSTYSGFDHIMYVMPQVVEFSGVAAFAYGGYYRSVFHNAYASSLQVQVHEIGHNLYMKHSGEGSSQYGDYTGMMGGQVAFYDNGPHMCFNAAKSWYLGWYSDAHAEIQPNVASWQGNLVGVDDYVKGNLDTTIHTVVGKIGTRLYMMYNRKKGVNNETQEYGDEVVIVDQEKEANFISYLQAHLSNGQQHRFVNWGGGSSDLVVEVCDRNSVVLEGKLSATDFARVLVYLDDGVHNLSCNSSREGPGTSDPTSGVPSEAPTTSSPSSTPSLAPSTAAPAANPSSSPSTAAPSGSPSSAPSTAAPSANPSSAPSTAAPSANPSSAPSTSAPTTSPSAAPSTPAPSATPSSSPTTSPPSIPPPLATSPPSTASPLTCQSVSMIEGTCSIDADCCGNMICSKGKATTRYCFIESTGGSSPTNPPASTNSPVTATPATEPPVQITNAPVTLPPATNAPVTAPPQQCSERSCRVDPCCPGLSCDSKFKCILFI